MERLDKRIVLAVLGTVICLSIIASAIRIFNDEQESDIAMLALDLNRTGSSANHESVKSATPNSDHRQVSAQHLPSKSYQPQVPNSFEYGVISKAESSQLTNRGVSAERPSSPRIKPISFELRQVIESPVSPSRFGSTSTIETNQSTSLTVSAPLPVVSSPSNEGDGAKRKTSSFKRFRLQPLSSSVKSTVMKKVEYADSLARRGAISTAELELRGALLAISESLDRQTSSRQYSDLVAGAFIAFREAEDFANVLNDVDLIAAGHSTQIFQIGKQRNLTGKQAAMIYFQHAESLLQKALDGQPAASNALRSLGKLYGIANRFGEKDDNSIAKSMVMYRLATRLNLSDARALAELGVLYAKLNRLEEAKGFLVQSLRIEPVSSTWKSLASVHSGLGEYQLSQQAKRESQLSAGSRPTGVVNWTSPGSFNQVNAMVEPPIMAATLPSRQRNTSPQSAPQQRISGNGIGHFNWR